MRGLQGYSQQFPAPPQEAGLLSCRFQNSCNSLLPPLKRCLKCPMNEHIEHPPWGHFFGVFSSQSSSIRLAYASPCRENRAFVNIPRYMWPLIILIIAWIYGELSPESLKIWSSRVSYCIDSTRNNFITTWKMSCLLDLSSMSIQGQPKQYNSYWQIIPF